MGDAPRFLAPAWVSVTGALMFGRSTERPARVEGAASEETGARQDLERGPGPAGGHWALLATRRAVRRESGLLPDVTRCEGRDLGAMGDPVGPLRHRHRVVWRFRELAPTATAAPLLLPGVGPGRAGEVPGPFFLRWGCSSWGGAVVRSPASRWRRPERRPLRILRRDAAGGGSRSSARGVRGAPSSRGYGDLRRGWRHGAAGEGVRAGLPSPSLLKEGTDGAGVRRRGRRGGRDRRLRDNCGPSE